MTIREWGAPGGGGGTGAVDSVNGRTGVVVIDFGTLQGGTLAQLNALISDSDVPGLDAMGRIPVATLPISAVTHQGGWDAQQNTPTLAPGVGNDGDLYWTTVAGNTDLDSATTGSDAWDVGDAAIFVAATSTWHRIPASAASSPVNSVNGATGNVVLAFATAGGNTAITGGTLAELSALVSDATLDDSGSSRPADTSAIANNDMVRSNGTTLVAASAREEDTEFIFDKSIRAPQTSLFLGQSVQLASVAEGLGVFDLVDNTNTLTIAQRFTSAGGSSLPEYLSFPAAAVVSEQTVSSSQSTAATTVEFVVNDGSAGLETISDSADFRIASVPAGGVPMRVQIYRGSDATGVEVADIEIDTPAVGVNTVDIVAGLRFLGATDYFVRISSSASFSLDGTAGPPFVPTYELRGHVVTRQPLATQAYSNANVAGLPVFGTPTDGQALVYNAAQNRVEWRDVAATSQPATITNFHTNAPARVDPGTSLTGNSYQATYELDNTGDLTSAQLVGFPTNTPASRTIIVASASRTEGSNTQAWTFPAGTFFATEGEAYTIQFEAFTAVSPSTAVVTASQEIRAQAAGRSDVLYYGVTTQDVAANVDVLTLQSQTGTTGVVTLPTTWAGPQRVVFCRPNSDGPYTQIVQVASGINVIASFPRTASAFQVGGVNYDVYLADGADTSTNFGGSQWNLIG